jgi:DNA-binding XRE family transcriptional regulator
MLASIRQPAAYPVDETRSSATFTSALSLTSERPTNLTQEDLAERAGWSQSNISKLERGKHRPRLDKVLGLQHALELRSIEELFGAPPNPPTGRLMGTNG